MNCNNHYFIYIPIPFPTAVSIFFGEPHILANMSEYWRVTVNKEVNSLQWKLNMLLLILIIHNMHLYLTLETYPWNSPSRTAKPSSLSYETSVTKGPYPPLNTKYHYNTKKQVTINRLYLHHQWLAIIFLFTSIQKLLQ